MEHDTDMGEFLQFSQVANRQKITFPAVVFNRTPNRERTISAVVVPARAQTPIQSSKRISQDVLSPQGMRRSKAYDRDSLEGSRCTNKENRDSLNLGPGVPRCRNHVGKSAAFEVIEAGEERLIYCQKCAILLASQGHKVQRLTKEQQHNSLQQMIKRREELGGIMQRADETIGALGTRRDELCQWMSRVDSTLHEELDKAHSYFDFVHQLVEKCRTQACTQIVEDHRQSKYMSEQLIEIVDDSLAETERIKGQVEECRDKIAQYPQDKYTPVVQLCKLKLASYKRSLKDYPLEELQPPHPDYKHAQQLDEAVTQTLAITAGPSHMLNSSKKLRGRNASIYFSFDADKASDIIPEENQGEEES